MIKRSTLGENILLAILLRLLLSVRRFCLKCFKYYSPTVVFLWVITIHLSGGLCLSFLIIFFDSACHIYVCLRVFPDECDIFIKPKKMLT
jgi:hypothetical protein